MTQAWKGRRTFARTHFVITWDDLFLSKVTMALSFSAWILFKNLSIRSASLPGLSRYFLTLQTSSLGNSQWQ